MIVRGVNIRHYCEYLEEQMLTRKLRGPEMARYEDYKWILNNNIYE